MITMFRGIRRAVFAANRLQAVVAGWAVLVIMGITCYGVFTRYVLRSPDIWSFPLSAYLLCFVVFLAVSHTLQKGVHVRVDFFVEAAPAWLARIMRFLGDVATFTFVTIFIWQTWQIFEQSFGRGRVDETTLGWHLAAIQWILPIAGGFLLVTHVLMMITRLIGEELEEEQEWES